MRFFPAIRFLGLGIAFAGVVAPCVRAQVVSAPAIFKSDQPLLGPLGPPGSVRPPRQAFSFQPPAPVPSQHMGFRITRLVPGLAADRAGFKTGDVIVQVGNHGFRSEDDMYRLLRQSSSVIKVSYFEGQTGIVKVREVRHLFARMGITGEVVPLGPPPTGLPVLPPGPIVPPGTLPPGVIFPPVNPGSGG